MLPRLHFVLSHYSYEESVFFEYLLRLRVFGMVKSLLRPRSCWTQDRVSPQKSSLLRVGRCVGCHSGVPFPSRLCSSVTQIRLPGLSASLVHAKHTTRSTLVVHPGHTVSCPRDVFDYRVPFVRSCLLVRTSVPFLCRCVIDGHLLGVLNTFSPFLGAVLTVYQFTFKVSKYKNRIIEILLYVERTNVI